jgi:type IX secretion system PorP/SprF family membrane protein
MINVIKHILICFFIITIQLDARDPVFTQFYVNKMFLNPAFAGSSDHARLILDYRNYWPELSNTFVNYNASYDQPWEPAHGGFGFNILNDAQGKGAINKLFIDGIYSYCLKINRQSNLRAGFQTSFIHHKLDASSFVFSDMYNTENMDFSSASQDNIHSEKASNIDFSAGLLWDFRVRHQYYYFGFATHHLTEPFIIFNGAKKPLPRKYTFHFGTLFPVLFDRFGREKLFLSPLLLYQRQGNYEQVQYKCIFSFDNYKTGIGIRQDLLFNINSVILSAGISMDDVDVVYSYDQSIFFNGINNYNLMAHEVTFLLKIKYKGKGIKKNTIKYPEF